MRRLRAVRDKAHWISKVSTHSLFFISVLIVCFVGGCVVEATPEQIAVAKQLNIFLGEGYSVAFYPVSLQLAVDAAAQVGAAHNAACNREYVFVKTNDRQKGQWVEMRPYSPAQEPVGVVTAYMSRWCLKSPVEGRRSDKYYDITITPFPPEEQPENAGAKVVIDPVLTIWCAPSDYDMFISLNQMFQEKLGVKCLPIPKDKMGGDKKPAEKD